MFVKQKIRTGMVNLSCSEYSDEPDIKRAAFSYFGKVQERTESVKINKGPQKLRKIKK